MKKNIFLLWTLTFLHADIYEEGKQLYFSNGCNVCHGPNAQGSTVFPKLANQRYDRLIIKLNNYKHDKVKTSNASIMVSYAKALSDSDVQTVSYFLSNFVKDKNVKRYDAPYETWGDGGS